MHYYCCCGYKPIEQKHFCLTLNHKGCCDSRPIIHLCTENLGIHHKLGAANNCYIGTEFICLSSDWQNHCHRIGKAKYTIVIMKNSLFCYKCNCLLYLSKWSYMQYVSQERPLLCTLLNEAMIIQGTLFFIKYFKLLDVLIHHISLIVYNTR